jgi:hypothetical protein
MPDSMIAIINRVVATGRRMKGRDGLMSRTSGANADASRGARGAGAAAHGAPRDRRDPRAGGSDGDGAADPTGVPRLGAPLPGTALPEFASPGVASPGVALF